LLVCFIATGSGKVVLRDAEISNFLRLYPNANFSGMVSSFVCLLVCC